MSERRKREFKHTPGPWKAANNRLWVLVQRDTSNGGEPEAVAAIGVIAAESDRGHANERVLTAAPDLCALLAEIEAAILSLLPDIDPVIGVRKRVKELLDGIEKGDA